MRIIHLVSSAMFLWCLTFLVSCTDPGTSPEIKVIDSLECYQTLNGHYLEINLEIYDDEGLAEYWIDLESSTGQKYFSDKRQIDTTYHNISYQVDIQSNEKESYFLEVKVVDIEGSKTKKKFPIRVE